MPGATPTQAFAYPVPADNPAQLAATWATLAGQVDLKAKGYDTDSARVQANNMVKVSVTGSPDSASNNVGPLMNTIEVNRGTSTDLTVFNGLLLPPGFWVFGGSVLYTPLSAGNILEVYPSIITYPSGGSPAPIPSGIPYDIMVRDPAGLVTGSLFDGLVTGNNFVDLGWFQTALTGVRLGATTQIGRTFVYADLWAFQVGDA